LVFDQKLSTHQHLAELDELGVGFITLRQRHPKLIAALEALPAGAMVRGSSGRVHPRWRAP
jgi:hypothetical protein